MKIEKLLEQVDKVISKLDACYNYDCIQQIPDEEIEDVVDDSTIVLNCCAIELKARDKRIAELELNLKEQK